MPVRVVVAGQRAVQHGCQERAGGGDVAGLLEEQGAIGARSGTEWCVLRKMAPQRLVRRRVVDVRAHERRRALAFEQLARGVLEELLVVGEREVHVYRVDSTLRSAIDWSILGSASHPVGCAFVSSVAVLASPVGPLSARFMPTAAHGEGPARAGR